MIRYQTIEEELKKCPELRLEDLKALREWAKLQPHLPNIDDIPDVYLSLFLRRRYYSLERAKHTLDHFLTIKGLVPEFLDNRNTERPEVKEYLAMNHTLTLKQRDANGNVIFFHHLHETDPSKFEHHGLLKTWFMMLDSWCMENGSAAGVTIVIDHTNMSFGYLTRISLPTVKKVNQWNKHGTPMSVKDVYFINASPVIQKFMAFFQPVLDGELFRRMKTYTPSEMDEFYKHIPQEWLPNEYGGKAGNLEELNEETVSLLQRHNDFYEKLDRLKVDESKRSNPENSMKSLLGIDGTFKKLNVD